MKNDRKGTEMKKILLCYFVLLPIILLVAFTPVVDFFRNIAWVALVLSILLIIYAVIKTRAFYHLKKVLLIVILSSLFYGGDNFVFGTSACWAETRDLSYTFEAGKKAEEKREQSHGESCAKRYEKMHEDIEKISEIPPINRTAAQQRKYNELLKSIKDLGKECKGQLEYCEPVSELYNKATQNCWACDIADLFLGAGDKVVTNFYKNVKGKVLALLAIGFFCWILIHVTKLIMSMGVGDTGKFITDFFVKCFVVGGIAIILSAPLRNALPLP